MKRQTGRPFTPGVSGNPRGRPPNNHALAIAIRENAGPAELVAAAMSILRKGDASQQLQALSWLAANGYSKPAERHEVLTANVPQIDVQRVLSKLSEPALRELLALTESTEPTDES